MGEAARLQKKYLDEVQDALRKDFNYANVMQVPRLTKIVVNMGLGEAAREPKVMDSAIQELTLITGRKPYVTLARKSIAGFKLREGMKIGAKVTLRGEVMWEFLDRLVSIALPRVRDFRGISPKGCDGRATSRWVSASKSFSPRSITTRSTRSRDLTSRWLRQPKPTKNASVCFVTSECRFVTNSARIG